MERGSGRHRTCPPLAIPPGANIPVVSRVVGHEPIRVLWRRSRRPPVTGMPLVRWGSGLPLASHLADLQLPHFILEVGDVLSAISNIRVNLLLYERVIRRLPHVRRSVDKGLFPLDLAVDRGHELIVAVHDCGIGL